MENALHNDFAIQQRATTGDEPATSTSPYETRFLIEVHKRSMFNYVQGLCGVSVYGL